MGEHRRTKTSGEDRTEGAKNKVKGRLKEAAGAVTGNEDGNRLIPRGVIERSSASRQPLPTVYKKLPLQQRS
jgi:hypothetical protein